MIVTPLLLAPFGDLGRAFWDRNYIFHNSMEVLSSSEPIESDLSPRGIILYRTQSPSIEASYSKKSMFDSYVTEKNLWVSCRKNGVDIL